MKPGKPVLVMFELVSCEIDQHFKSVMKLFLPGLKECIVTYVIALLRDLCRLSVKSIRDL